MARNEPGADVMFGPGMFETRTVYGVKRHVPNRFDAAGFPGQLDDDWVGWIHFEGQRVAVETAYYGMALIWRVAPEGE